MDKKVVFITGGIRSGKSVFAENMVSTMGEKVTYVATARVSDDEMKHRISLHRERRPNFWGTVEEPLKAADAILAHGHDSDVIMIDCLTILISNLMFEHEDEQAGDFHKLQVKVLKEINRLIEAITEVKAHVVTVSNEVGLTLVSDNTLGRRFQELVGLANQMMAEAADEVYLVVAGYPIVIKNRR